MKLPLRKKKENKPLTQEQRLNQAEKVAMALQKARLGDYITYMNSPWRIIWTNLLIGVSRSVGLTIGFALVIVITVKILSILIAWKFPWLSEASSGLLDVIKATPGMERFTDVIDQSMADNPTR